MNCLKRALTVAACVVSVTAAAAADFPSRPITFVVSFAPGGLSDVPARLLGAEMAKAIGGSIIIENKPGASGITGASSVLRAEPDGHTLLVSAISEVQNLHYLQVPFKFTADFAQVGKIADGPPLVLMVNATSPYKSLADLVAAAKAQPDKISFATSGPATSPAIAVSQLNAMAGTKIVEVPYRGTAPAATAVVAGEVQGGFVFYPSVQPYVQSGHARALAVASAKRVKGLEDIPTMAELGFAGFEHDAFVGLTAPRGTPDDIISKLNKALNQTIQLPEFRARLEALGMRPPEGDNTPASFKKYLETETARQAELAAIVARQPAAK